MVTVLGSKSLDCVIPSTPCLALAFVPNTCPCCHCAISRLDKLGCIAKWGPGALLELGKTQGAPLGSLRGTMKQHTMHPVAKIVCTNKICFKYCATKVSQHADIDVSGEGPSYNGVCEEVPYYIGVSGKWTFYTGVSNKVLPNIGVIEEVPPYAGVRE